MANPAWVKGGRSPNPSGRGLYKGLSDAIRIELISDPSKARKIAERLVNLAMEDADPKVSIAAAHLLLDRMEGKASQSIDIAIDHTITLSVEERRARLAELVAKRGQVIEHLKDEEEA